MKGFKDPQGKFRPTENKNGIRKSRDQSVKTEGVKLLSLRKQREPKQLPNQVVMEIKEDFNGSDVEVVSYNPKWKLYEVHVDDERYYIFPNEESAIKFGRQSIRDTATEYIPEKGTEGYDEWKDLDEDELVDKIIEMQSDYGQRSELGAIAQSISGYDGQYHQLSDGWIAFRID